MTKLNDDMFGPLQRAWLEALESGAYQQTSNFLKTDRGFCCLGVACELFAPDQWVRVGEEDGHPCHFKFGGEVGVLSMQVRDDYGFFNLNGGPHGDASVADRSLSMMNDDGCTFEEIAAKVRSNPRMYFREAK